MRITVLGLGIIGSIWARHLAADGHQVRTWNRNPKSDAPGFTADPLAAVAGAELVLVVVADGPAVLDVLARVAPALAPGAVVCQHATIAVAQVAAAAALVRARGARFVDLPFTGSKVAAENRQNVFFVGDDDGSFASVEAVYARLAERCLALGPVGRAMALKLALNLQLAGINQAQAEAIALARHAGISDDTWFTAVGANIARSPYVELKRAKVLSRDWSPQFSLKHMHKDLRLALELATGLGLTLPTTVATERQYQVAQDRGLAELDMAAQVEVVDPTELPSPGA